MPNVPTYIKGDDLDKYLAIHSEGRGAWSEFIHKALNEPRQVPPGLSKEELRVFVKPIKTPKMVKVTPTLDETALGGPRYVIKTPKDAEKAVESRGFISKEFSARKKK